MENYPLIQPIYDILSEANYEEEIDDNILDSTIFI